jgi:predicted flap endonuclease-1-like 5' DNA nuclease
MNASLSPEVALPAPPAQAAIPGPVASPALEAIAADASNLKSNFSQIRGISEKRTEQLNSIGIYTIQQLANASPDDLAAKLNLSPRIVKMWIGTAKKMAK